MESFEPIHGRAGADGEQHQGGEGEQDQAGAVAQERPQRFEGADASAESEWCVQEVALAEPGAVETHGVGAAEARAGGGRHDRRTYDQPGQRVGELVAEGDVRQRQQHPDDRQADDQGGPPPTGRERPPRRRPRLSFWRGRRRPGFVFGSFRHARRRPPSTGGVLEVMSDSSRTRIEMWYAAMAASAMSATNSSTSTAGTTGRSEPATPQPARRWRSENMPETSEVRPSTPETYQRMKAASSASGASSVQARR